MAVQRVTEATLRGLRGAPAGTELRDADLPGFAVRVTRGGAVTFSYAYRKGGRGSRQRRLTIGTWPAVSLAKARKEARNAREAVRVGKDPGEKSGAATVAAIGVAFLAAHDATPWRREQARVLAANVLPKLGDRAVDTLGRGELIRFLEAIVRRGAPATAIRIRKDLWQMWEWALDRELITRNPMHAVDPPAEEESRDRVFTPDELRRLWRELEVYTGPLGLTLALELFTAQRGGEILGMRASEIEGDWWTIPAERTKSKRAPHAVYLNTLARAAIARARPAGDLLFPGANGRKMKSTAPSQAMARIAERAGVTDAVPHDLRRTAATLLSERLALDGKSDFIVGIVLNHSNKSAPRVTGVYNRYRYATEKREAMILLENILREILDDRPAVSPGAEIRGEPAAPSR